MDNITPYSEGGEGDWLLFEQRKYFTNAFIVQHDNKRILLGLKKRGFGKDKYNGFGGKVEDGETSAEAAVRELQEEAGITAALEYSGTMLFFSEGSDFAYHIDYYSAAAYQGTVTETEEMRPEWFALPDVDATEPSTLPQIPFHQMWEDDHIWFPLLIAKRIFNGRVDFRLDANSQHKLTKWWFGAASAS
ncbi:hypothetical protein NEOLEDRAFT_1087660 [Neolentinus lepideus HHB14362 ss-1]|uniref:Oxidized purine nucleoside triphosphate hydrolase n=1 Tax=Neolentinus lepideus HHB14362 ss-1 TaxID=1314782 RepID=A0A165UFC4_9AGAM|nr:hypothetical protein NEOLEDRAFT_1087660 [Neolentinus lepideus HHB14362 ss-1]